MTMVLLADTVLREQIYFSINILYKASRNSISALQCQVSVSNPPKYIGQENMYTFLQEVNFPADDRSQHYKNSDSFRIVLQCGFSVQFINK